MSLGLMGEEDEEELGVGGVRVRKPKPSNEGQVVTVPLAFHAPRLSRRVLSNEPEKRWDLTGVGAGSLVPTHNPTSCNC